MENQVVSAKENKAPQESQNGVLLSMRGISKSFPGTKALNNVDFTLRKGEIHALMGLQGSLYCPLESTAAGHLHPQDGNALDVIQRYDLAQLFGVIDCIQFGAADERDFAAHEFLVHVGVGVGRAVRGDQELRPVKEGRLHRNELDLAGPLSEA